MRIKEYEQTETETLTVAGVKSELVRYFKEYVQKRNATGAYYMDQILDEFRQSTEKQPKPAKKTKAAAA